MIWRTLLLVWIAGWIVAAFLYFHIPVAWVTVLALGWSMVHSILYLRRRNFEHDHQAAAAAEIGLLFCIAATVSGSMWAKAMWGAYWNWDPRETSIFFLLLVYAAYLALRSAIDQEQRRARLAAVYSAAAFVSVPFLMFVVPRIYFTLHPDPLINPRGKIDMDPRIRMVFFALLAGFTGLFFWMLQLRVRVARLERRAQEALGGMA
jgi:heme exporter protein C